MFKIIILGCGPGHPDYLLPLTKKKALGLDLLLGSPRLLKLFPDFAGQKVELKSPLQEGLSFLAQSRLRSRCGVLVSGSPLRFSLASLVIKTFGQEECEVVPGISVADLALSRLGLVGKQIGYFSVHGRKKNFDLSTLLPFEVVVVFLDKDLNWLDQEMFEHFTWTLLEDLGLPSERIQEINYPHLPKYQGLALLVGVKRI